MGTPGSFDMIALMAVAIVLLPDYALGYIALAGVVAYLWGHR